MKKKFSLSLSAQLKNDFQFINYKREIFKIEFFNDNPVFFRIYYENNFYIQYKILTYLNRWEIPNSTFPFGDEEIELYFENLSKEEEKLFFNIFNQPLGKNRILISIRKEDEIFIMQFKKYKFNGTEKVHMENCGPIISFLFDRKK